MLSGCLNKTSTFKQNKCVMYEFKINFYVLYTSLIHKC